MFRTARSYWHSLGIVIAMLILLFYAALPGIVQAANTSASTSSGPKGLLITPVRDFLSVDAGGNTSGNFTVANLSDKPMDVTLSVKQFSVANYTYDYTFNQPKNDWLHLELPAVSLQPDERRQIPFNVRVPADSAPGGQYYTLFASAQLNTGGLNSTVQATDLLYVTVGGKLIRTSQLQTARAPGLAFSNINYSLQALNTGNVHFFAYSSGRLHGWLTKPAGTPDAHLLMPGRPRVLTGTVAAPVLPGVYKLTLGYRTDQGQQVQAQHWVVFIPPWFIALLLAGLLFAGQLARRRLPRGKPRQSHADSPHTDSSIDQ